MATEVDPVENLHHVEPHARAVRHRQDDGEDAEDAPEQDEAERFEQDPNEELPPQVRESLRRAWRQSCEGEEVDLCLRAKAIGARPRVTPASTIIHYGGASQAVRSDRAVRLLKAKMELIKRHFPPHSSSLSLALFRLWPLSRRIACGIGGRLLGRTNLIEQGKIWAEVWARRGEWQGGFTG